METLQLLGTALGLGALAGINLYLTVFVAGLAIQQGWISLAPQYAQLEVLGHPAVVVVAGVFYALQFFADKVPWVDSLWDLVHSVIRPVGAAFLAVQVLGDSNAVFDVVVALLAGGVALSTHGLKAGARLVANSSPEPFSNVALSVTEDVAVVGGLMLVAANPVVALVCVVLLVGAILYFGPKILRSVRARLWLAWRKLNIPAGVSAKGEEGLPALLPADTDMILHTLVPGSEAPVVEWAVPCIAAGSRQLGANAFGHLVALRGERERLYFIGNGRLRRVARALDFTGYRVAQEGRFLSENLVLYTVDRRPKEVFFFERAHRHRVGRLVEALRNRFTPADEVAAPPPQNAPTPSQGLPPFGESAAG